MRLFSNKYKKKNSLVNKFSGIISISIFTTVVFLSVYYLYTSTVLIKQNKVEKDGFYNSVISLAKGKAEAAINSGRWDNMEEFSSEIVKHDLVLYVTITDSHNGKVVWSSIKQTNGIHLRDFWKNKYVQLKMQNISDNSVRYESRNISGYNLHVAFYDPNSLVTLVNILLKGYMTLAVVFIIFGFAIALIMATNVIKPIKELASGAEEFSKGNLKYRSKVSTEDEIGKLADAFNTMAGNLDDLYSSLEQQVKERTYELSLKNDELQGAYKELKEAQVMMVHNEKMSSLGQLVAGLAHELNNPINFIYGNLEHLKNYVNDLTEIISEYEKVEPKLSEAELSFVADKKADCDYEFILEDLPALMKSCKDGAERCKQIIIDLKNFSRLDEAMLKEIDIREGLDSTLNILSGKLKNGVNVHKNYSEIPKLACFAGQLNQVFMNIIDNSVHAVKGNGDVFISTSCENNNIIVSIADNGSGIDADALPKIFDPFFTTKPVGEGTGMGLAISYKIIKKHCGNIEVTSQKGKGTEFLITIPLDWYKTAKSEETSESVSEGLKF